MIALIRLLSFSNFKASEMYLIVQLLEYYSSSCLVAQSYPTESCNLWTVAHQASPSMEFSRQEYWSGLPFPSPGDLSNPGIEPRSPALQADSLPAEPQEKPTTIMSLLINIVSSCSYLML